MFVEFREDRYQTPYTSQHFISERLVLYCTVLYCTVLYCTVLYCTVLYCTVLYCTVLYCTVLYYSTHPLAIERGDFTIHTVMKGRSRVGQGQGSRFFASFAFQRTVDHFNAPLQCTLLHCTALHSFSLFDSYSTIAFAISFHCTDLHCIVICKQIVVSNL